MTERKYFDYDEKEMTPSQAAKRRYKQKHREKVLKDARTWANKDYKENPEKHKKKREERKEYYSEYYREHNPIKPKKEKIDRYEVVKKYRENHPEKWKAQCKANNAVQSGKLISPKNCQVCNVEEKLEKHHHDYSKPLEVVWCCKKCHVKLDKLR